jgi:HSP20 family protein
MMMPVRRSQTWLPNIFNDFFDNNTWVEKNNITSPSINVIENEKEFVVEVAAPGMTKEDFNIRVDENDNLVISMEKRSEEKEDKGKGKKEGRYLRREFSYSKFQQTLILPDCVEQDKIKAQVEHGVLTISIPKTIEDETKKVERVIEIK